MSEELKPCPCCHKDASPYWKGAGCTNTDCMLCGMCFDYDDWQNKRAELSAIKGGAVAAHRLINSLGEVITEWHDGPPPERITDVCGVVQTNVSVELAYTHPPVVAEAEPVSSKVGAIEGGVVPGWRVTGRGGYSLCAQYPAWAEDCDDLKIEQLYVAPPASGAVPVPCKCPGLYCAKANDPQSVPVHLRPLLGRLVGRWIGSPMFGEADQWAALEELRELLAKGVE